MRVLTVIHQDDAGPGVFGHVAAERGHELVEWRPAVEAEPPDGSFGAALVFGGAMNVHEEEANPWLRGEKAALHELLGAGVPALGLCLGSQLLADVLGARVARAAAPEIGWKEVELTPEAAGDPVARGLPASFCAFQWHSYAFELPPGGVLLARSPVCPQAFRAGTAWGIQFHAEVTREIAGCWTDDFESDPDAVAIGVEPASLKAEIAQRIGEWNEIGRRVCGGFLDAAAAR